MAASAVPSGTVLGDDNYNNWRACMKSYMMAHDLWDVVEASEPPHQQAPEAELKAWKQKNAAALHAIQTSCAPHILSKITEIEVAKSAWDFLAGMDTTQLQNLPQQQLPENQQHSPPPTIGPMSYEATELMFELKKKIQEGNWEATREALRQHPQAITAPLPDLGGTLLHVAAEARNAAIVEKLVELMSAADLEVVDIYSNNALDIALAHGNTRMVKCLIHKNGNLISILNKEGILPLVYAARGGDEDSTYHLYAVTPIELLYLVNSRQGYLFLNHCILSGMLDLALHVLERFPMHTAGGTSGCQWYPLSAISVMPEVFRSGCRLVFWKEWIYSCLPEKLPDISKDVRFSVSPQSRHKPKDIKQQVARQLLKQVINLLKFTGIKQIYDLKQTHLKSYKFVHIFCTRMLTIDNRDSFHGGLRLAWQRAIEYGIEEIIVELVKINPQMIVRTNEQGGNLFFSSIYSRQEKIFNLFYGLEGIKIWPTATLDYSDNTMLHMAAYLSPPSQLARISGAALQMQRELQWYKEIQRIVNPTVIRNKNKDGYTARQLFTHSHKDLVKEGEKWMKETATSCTVVGALIITIVFAAAFTVPGGSKQDTGIPNFVSEKSFITFIVSDAISLFAGTTSVLMFLGILTSRYAEEDFLRSLPTKMIIGLSTLFISIAAMIIAFCASLIIILEGRLKIVIPVVLLAGVPVALFMLLQFPLLVDILYSTYGPGIFNKKMKRWY